MGCVSMFAQESLPPAIDEQATARQLGLSEVEMARTARCCVLRSCFTRIDQASLGRVYCFSHAVTETANIALVITLAAALTCG